MEADAAKYIGAGLATLGMIGAGIGIHSTGASSRIEENQINGGQIGIQVDGTSSNFITKNSVRGTTNPYSVPVGNFMGPVVSTPAGVASASAWANFAF